MITILSTFDVILQSCTCPAILSSLAHSRMMQERDLLHLAGGTHHCCKRWKIRKPTLRRLCTYYQLFRVFHLRSMHWQGSNSGVSRGQIYTVTKEIEPTLAIAWNKLALHGAIVIYACYSMPTVIQPTGSQQDGVRRRNS